MKLHLPKTYLKFLFIAVLFSFSTLGWGQTVAQHTFAATSGSIDSNVTFTTQQNNGTTAPTFNTGLRLYYQSSGAGNGGSITLLPQNGVTITKVEVTAKTGQAPTMKYNVDGNADVTVTAASLIYTIQGITAVTSLKMRNANTTNVRMDLMSIKVTYTPATSAPTVTTTTATSITTTDASSGGNVTADGGASVTARGVVYGTATAPTLANSVVTTGSGTGSYTSALTGLSVNTRYYYRAYATNSVNTSYGSESNFYTLANVPGALVIGTPLGTSIPVSFNSGTENSNPAITTYAIQETGGLYVQAGGSLGASAVFQTAATWGTISVTGLSNNTTYTFHAKARNGDLAETTFGATASGTTTGPVAPVVTGGSPSGTYNVAFSYNIIATNTPTSYGISSGTLPAGLTLNTTTGEISGTPTAAGSSSVDVTATNGAGTGTGTLNFTIAKANQTITFASTDTKVYGTADYAPSATSATSGVNAITYSSDTPSVATIVSDQIHIVGFGTAIITASQASSSNYNAATANQTLTVTKKGLTITGLTANNKVQDGTTAATLSGTPGLAGVVSGEESNVILGGTPVATFASAAPANGIVVTVTGYTISGSASANYTLTQPTGLTANITALGVPTATAATVVLQNGFTANWNAVTGASGYVLDVHTMVSTPSPELVVNGDFESGNVTSWTFESAMNQVASTSQAHTGTHSLYSTVLATKNMSQNITVVSGEEYVLGFWYYIDATSTGNGFRVWTTSGATVQLPSTSTYFNTKGSWQYIEQVFTASASTIVFNMRLYSGVKLYLDDISIKLTTAGPTVTPVSGSPFSISAPATSYNLSSLAAETTYYYTVKSVNGSFTSGASNEISQITDTAPVIWDGDSWTNGSGPTASIEAIIEGVYSTALSGGFTAKKLTLTSGSFTVNSGTNVTVVGEVINDMAATDFVVESNANLLQGGTSNNNSGDITVKRNSAAIKRLDYTLWSSPVAGQGLYAFSKFTLPNRFYVYDSSNDTYSNSVGFNLTGLQYPSPLVAPNGVNGNDLANVPFVPGNGYLIRVPYDHPTTATPYAGTFTGVPNTGTITLSGLTNGLYYAIGNPYPSTIDADQFIADNGIGDTLAPGDGLYFWRKTNNAGSSSYATYTTAGGVASGGDTSSVPIVPNGVIQVGEGFIVRATSTSIGFNNDQRIANNDNQFLRTNLVERNRIWLNLTDATANVNQMMVSYMTGATQDIDAGIDGRFFNDSPTALNSLLNNEEFAIQGRSLPFEATDIVPLAFKAETEGNYSISIDHVDGLFTGGTQAIYLKDNLTTTVHNLNTGSYSFATAAGTFNNRFEIVYQPQLANPIFTANTVIIYSQGNGFVVNSGNFVMSSIKVFDIRGRLIEEKKDINTNETTINGGLSNGVLLVQITTEDGTTVTKKIIR